MRIRSHADALAVTACLLGAAPAPARAALRPIARVPSVGQFGTTPDLFSAIVNGFSPGNTPPGQPYYARLAGGPVDDRTSDLSLLGFSSEPLQVSMDPRPDAPYRWVYSLCSGTGASATCALRSQQLGGQTLYDPVTDSAVGTRDRLPSTYGGATAFSRSRAGERSAQLRYAAAIGAASQPLLGGPQGTGAAGPLGIALHARVVAYVWRWKAPSGYKTALRLQRVGSATQTLVSLPAARGRVIGPSWQGRRLIFGIRRPSGASTWYRYDPATRRYASAKGPHNLAAVAATRRFLYWQSAAPRALRTGRCSSSPSPSSCRVGGWSWACAVRRAMSCSTRIARSPASPSGDLRMEDGGSCWSVRARAQKVDVSLLCRCARGLVGQTSSGC